jgi:hypothetical protein
MPLGIFVTAREHLEGGQGGVQMCTREYVQVIEAANVQLMMVLLESDRRLSTRVLRRVTSSKYFRPAAPKSIKGLIDLVKKERPDFVFLNQVALAGLASMVRPSLPVHCKIVVLSHGLESTDLLHHIRLSDRLPLTGRIRPTASTALGRALLTETALRKDIDIVCALSPFDVELERWLGAKRVGWLPRIVQPIEFDWRPCSDRFGFVGTLDHGPNLEGLVSVLDELARRDNSGAIRIRVVGGPDETGRWLAKNYSIVDYLGRLDDQELRQEATTWNAFIHPLFCYARGCSTKLATAISWQIPIITTTVGHRGYIWREGELVVADDEVTFVRKCIELRDPLVSERAAKGTRRIAATSPRREEVALKFWELVDF